jgi:hypothetical protein
MQPIPAADKCAVRKLMVIAAHADLTYGNWGAEEKELEALFEAACEKEEEAAAAAVAMRWEAAKRIWLQM